MKQSTQDNTKNNDVQDQVCRVLAFTCSKHRPLFIRHSVLQVQSQTHPTDHAVYINSPSAKNAEDKTNYQELLKDITPKEGTSIQIGYGNSVNQHNNHIAALNMIKINDYDLFLKIDDDDIYKTNYVSDIVNSFNSDSWDFSGEYAHGILNGIHLEKNVILKCLGENENDKKHNVIPMMPGTYAFSRKAIQYIIDEINCKNIFEDPLWRLLMTQKEDIKVECRDSKNYIYHIHGNNISTGHLLKK